MAKYSLLALSGLAMVFAAPHTQAAQFDTGARHMQSAPLPDVQITGKMLEGKAQQRRSGARRGGGRSFRGGHRGAGRSFRGGAQHFSGRNVHRGHRGFRSHRNFGRSEEHTSELQSRSDLVCRLLLEKKKY